MFHRVVAPGLELRQFLSSDAGEVFAVVDRNRERLREWLFWVDGTHSADQVREFIEAAQQQWDEGLGPNAAILYEGRIIGSMGSHHYDLARRNCSIGYWLDKAHAGRGIVTRCAASLLDYLFDEANLHRVEIRCGTGNHRSCAIPERLGFTREGVLRDAEWVGGRWVDLVVWGLLEHEWRRSVA
jgi:ribosomal-protein-serine acetyltransferase